ncbi:MAG: hypothetical protein L0J46_04525, partial [Enterococcus sp.]|uniref:hypothetical protein n=1 Tax=Enterococcus sp. TaxID=35783 RepID=UPI002647CDE6
YFLFLLLGKRTIFEKIALNQSINKGGFQFFSKRVKIRNGLSEAVSNKGKRRILLVKTFF